MRHLVLPNDLAATRECLRFIASLSTEITLSLMSQYNPVYKAREHPLLSRKLRPGEYWKTVELAEDLGFSNILIQDVSSPESYLPDFDHEVVFRD